MLKSIRYAASQAHIIHIEPGIECLILRRFNPHTDSWNELTALLHHAYEDLAALDLNCSRATQPSSVTRRLALAGDCFVAVCRGRIIATMTLDSPIPDSACQHYRNVAVASIHQFCVAPAWQQRGIGTTMIAFAEQWATARGYTELALDAPLEALHLIEFYRRLGFSLITAMRFPDRDYQSAVLGKRLDNEDSGERKRDTLGRNPTRPAIAYARS